MGRVTQDPTPVTEQPIAETSAAEVEKPVDISGFEREPEQATEPVTLQPEPEPASPTIPAWLHTLAVRHPRRSGHPARSGCMAAVETQACRRAGPVGAGIGGSA